MLGACQVETSPDLSASYAKNHALHSSFLESELTVDKHSSQDSTIRIITFGHIYHLQDEPELLNDLVTKVVEQEPHYVFVLGDIVFNNAQDEWDVMLKAFEKIECPLYFVGGNHDMNYHYERWFGKYHNQWEAEGRFIDNVGYRYKLIQDDFANYLILNFNDSLPRIESYLEQIKPQIDSTKMTILMSHQNIWKPTLATAKDPHTWPNKTMTGGELLKSLGFVNVFVNGDWNSYFKSETTANASRELTSISVGNKVKGDPLYITQLEISDNGVNAFPIDIEIDPESSWFDEPEN